MPSAEPFRSITDARIEVVQRQRRAAAFATMARAWGVPLLRPVSAADVRTDDPDANDVAVGLVAKLGCSGLDDLTGLLVMRERAVASSPPFGTAPERLFLIEALTVSSAMSDWRPPVQTLLAATAAALVATIHHDPSFRTFVAFRVTDGDRLADEAICMIGGFPTLPSVGGGGSSFVAGVPDRELRFLDARGAAEATRVVLAHMSGGASPSQPTASSPNGRTWQRRLAVSFPRAMHHLAEEMRLVAAGAVDVGWSVPIVAFNDVGEFGIANAARS